MDLRINDIVEINETDCQWIIGPWKARITQLFGTGDGYVQPIEPIEKLPTREKINPVFVVSHGLYLSRSDFETAKLIERSEING